MQIQISWLLQKPTDLDLHCLQNRVYPGSAGQRLNEIESDAQETFEEPNSRLSYACLCICAVWSRYLGLYSIKRLTWNMGRRPRIHMTNKAPDRHVHLHSLSSIFAIGKKKVRPFCLAFTHSSTEPACDVWFLKHMHSICPNDRMSEQRNKQINERNDKKKNAL